MARQTRSRTNPIAPDNTSGKEATNSPHGAIFVQGTSQRPEQEVSTHSANETSEHGMPTEPAAASPVPEQPAAEANISENVNADPVVNNPAPHSVNLAAPLHDNQDRSYHQPSTVGYPHWNPDTRADHPAPGPEPFYGNPPMPGNPAYFDPSQGRGYSQPWYPPGQQNGSFAASGPPAAHVARAVPLTPRNPAFPTADPADATSIHTDAQQVPEATGPGTQHAAFRAPGAHPVHHDYSYSPNINGHFNFNPNYRYWHSYPYYGGIDGYYPGIQYGQHPLTVNNPAPTSQILDKSGIDILAAQTAMIEKLATKLAAIEEVLAKVGTTQTSKPTESQPVIPTATTTQQSIVPESKTNEVQIVTSRPFRTYRVQRKEMRVTCHRESGNKVLNHNSITCIHPPPSDMSDLFDPTIYVKKAMLMKSVLSPDRFITAQTLADRCLVIDEMMSNLSSVDLIVHIIPDPEYPITDDVALLAADLGSLRSLFIQWLPATYTHLFHTCTLKDIRQFLKIILKDLWSIQINHTVHISEFLAQPKVLRGYALLASILAVSEDQDDRIIADIVQTLKQELDSNGFFGNSDWNYLRAKNHWEFIEEYILAQITNRQKFNNSFASYRTIQTAPFQPIYNPTKLTNTENVNLTKKKQPHYKKKFGNYSGGSQKQSRGVVPDPASKVGKTPPKPVQSKAKKGPGKAKGKQITTMSVQDILTINDGNTLEARKAELNSQLS